MDKIYIEILILISVTLTFLLLFLRPVRGFKRKNKLKVSSTFKVGEILSIFLLIIFVVLCFCSFSLFELRNNDLIYLLLISFFIASARILRPLK